MNNDNQHIPAGYKPSPLGIIPEDWEVKRLGEVCTFLDSQRVPIKDADRVRMKGKYPYYGASGIIDYVNDYLFDDDLILLGEDGANIINRSTPLAFLVSGKVWVNNHAHVLKAKDQYNRYFVCHYLESLTYDKYNTGTAQPKLNREICESIPVLIPNKDEQNKIATILQLWDTAIEKQTILIDQLILRKRGLMQQLLTGKKRLKGFNEKWKEVRLGDVASINRGGSPRPIEHYLTSGEGYNWIKIGDVGVNAKYITSTEEKIIKEGLSKTRFVKSGDFILSNSMSFGRPYILKIDGCIHDGWLVIQEYDKTFNIDFLYYILGYDTTLAQYKSMAAGSGVLNLNKEIVKEVLLKIPPIDEQKAIASILVNADKEIELANKKLASLQAQKKGLMQVLLTGKKRIMNQ